VVVVFVSVFMVDYVSFFVADHPSGNYYSVW